MTPTQAARLTAVSIALAIVFGSAGYGIGRGMQENEENTACNTYIEELKRDLQRSREEESRNQEYWARYVEVLIGIKPDGPCTCPELVEAFPPNAGIECVQEP